MGSRLRNNAGIYQQNPISKSYNCEYNSCEEKQKVGLFAFHLKGLRVSFAVRAPQFENRCVKRNCIGANPLGKCRTPEMTSSTDHDARIQ